MSKTKFVALICITGLEEVAVDREYFLKYVLKFDHLRINEWAIPMIIPITTHLTHSCVWERLQTSLNEGLVSI